MELLTYTEARAEFLKGKAVAQDPFHGLHGRITWWLVDGVQYAYREGDPIAQVLLNEFGFMREPNCLQNDRRSFFIVPIPDVPLPEQTP